MMEPSASAPTSPVLDLLRQLYESLLSVDDGAVATYIPELAKADPNGFGICLVTANGTIYEVGDSQLPFTIQSISKPFVYGLALEDNGRAPVLEKVGVEPTGDAFNSISLEPETGRPRNPMINAGAIAAAGLIGGKSQAGRLKRVIEMLSTYAGRPLELDEAVYRSESETGHRNRAIGHMLRNYNVLEGDPMEAVDLYFKQCSVSVTCRDLGIMAATLANRGLNPVTGKVALRGEYVENVLSVMASCGMYNSAGDWIYRVGIPAKSGVAGGVIAVLPGQIGIGVYSPRLDARGNSVRGILACDELSRHWDLHLFNRPAAGKSTIRRQFTGAELNSSRVRTAEEMSALRASGSTIRVYQLQGHLTFSTTEVVVEDIIQRFGEIQQLVVDLRRVLTLNEGACRLFWNLVCKLGEGGKRTLFTHSDRHSLLRRYFKAKLGRRCDDLFRNYEDNDLALEACENRLLAELLPGRRIDHRVTVADFELCEGLAPDEIEALASCLARRDFRPGDTIISVGERAEALFFLARGTVSVVVPVAGGGTRRLATFSPGMTFGEMAVIDRAPRSATILADTEVECEMLSLERFEELQRSAPRICIQLLTNLGRSLSQKLRKANRELAVLE